MDSRAGVATFESSENLVGQVVVVTGGGSGLGRAVATHVAKQGATVVVSDIAGDLAAAVTAEHLELGLPSFSIAADVSDADDVNSLFSEVAQKFGRLDGVCNAAGVSQRASLPILDLGVDEFDRIMGINSRGVFLCTQAAARIMVAQRRGSIVNLSSTIIDRSTPGLMAYACAKASVVQITRTAAMELGQHNVRVNSVAPGWIETPMTSAAYTRPDGSLDEDMRGRIVDAIAAQVPLACAGHPEDIAATTLFLLTNASRFITGQTIRVNGGISMA